MDTIRWQDLMCYHPDDEDETPVTLGEVLRNSPSWLEGVTMKDGGIEEEPEGLVIYKPGCQWHVRVLFVDWTGFERAMWAALIPDKAA